MVSLEELYQEYENIGKTSDKAKGEDSFKLFIRGIESGSNEKKLSSQFIGKFCSDYPQLAEESVDALLHLCEDKDITVRRQAIKDLPNLCNITVKYVPKLVACLVQLLLSEDSVELTLIQNSLITFFKVDCKGTLNTIFEQILSPTVQEKVRENLIGFLAKKRERLPQGVWDKGNEVDVVQMCKKVLEDCTGEEFVQVMSLLSSMPHMQTLQGRQQLVELVLEQAELDESFSASTPEHINRLIVCVRQALGLFSRNVTSTKFVSYICTQVLPALDDVHDEEFEGDLRLETLRLLAEISQFCTDLSAVEADVVISPLYDRLLTSMLPNGGVKEENGGTDKTSDKPEDGEVNFSYVECYLFAFHQLVKRKPDYLKDEDRLKELRKSLQYFAIVTQCYFKSLKADLASTSLSAEERRAKEEASRVTSNLNALVKDFLYTTPQFKAQITLSWKPKTQSERSESQGDGPTAKVIKVEDTKQNNRQKSSQHWQARGGGSRGRGFNNGYRQAGYRSW